jgi:hypothetical protein
MHHDVGAVLEGPAQVGRRHGVVDDEGDAVGVGHLRQLLEVGDVAQRVAHDSQNRALVRLSISLAKLSGSR